MGTDETVWASVMEKYRRNHGIRPKWKIFIVKKLGSVGTVGKDALKGREITWKNLICLSIVPLQNKVNPVIS